MTSNTQSKVFRYKRTLISFGIIVALLFILAALSYFWLPGYAKSQIEIRLSALLQRTVTVASIEFKPHTLELTVQGFEIGEKVGANEKPVSFLSFARLYIDLSIESVSRRAPVITAFTLEEPKVRLVREAENQLNISDLLEQFNKPSPQPEKKSEPALFSLSNFSIRNGLFEFDDRLTKSDHRVTDINLAVPIVANFESTLTSWIEPHFSAKINGSALSLDGKLKAFTQTQEATLALKLSDFDLTEFDQYAALPKGINLLSGLYDSELQITFKQAQNQAPEIILSGHTALKQFSIRNNAVKVPYRANLKQLLIELTDVDLTTQKPSDIKLQIDQIALVREGEKEPALSLAQLDIDQITIDAKKHVIALNEITLDRLKTTLRRDANGTIDLTHLFENTSGSESKENGKSHRQQPQATVKNNVKVPVPGRKPDPVLVAERSRAEPQNDIQKDTSVVKEEAAVAADAPWIAKIKQIRLKTAAVHYEDLTLTKIAPMIIDPLDLTLNHIDLSGAKPLNLLLQAQVNQRGKIKIDGSLAWSPLATELELNLDSVDVVSLQGWAGDKLTALLTSGDISFVGKIKAGGEPLKMQVNGLARLANLNVFDPNSAQDLLRWKKLELSDLNFVNEPLRVDIKTVSLNDFFARMAILPNGTLNLKQIVRQDASATAPPSPDVVVASAAGGATVTAPEKKDTPIHIDRIILQQGNVYFSDQFIKPNYRANLTNLAGQIGPLHPGKKGKIDIHGMVAKTAPLEIRGTTDPFSSELSLDLMAKVKNIDLPPFSPYSGKYIGYEIEKGKLSADVNYQIDKGVLSGDNKIFLDQFTLGEKIESEEAVSLPLNLAISILKNRRGEIDIHLPLKGSIDDPQFNLGDIIFTAFTNLITKAITSPFALLGSVLGGGEELSEIAFAPGFAEIDAEAEKRLQALAEVLDDRPALELEISGHIDPEQDFEGLKVAMLQNKVKAQKLAEQTKKGVASGAIEDMTLTPEEYGRYLEMAYKKEEFQKPKNAIGLAKSLPNAEMEQLMMANMQINENDLTALAERRANAARNWLVENGKIQDERIFVVGVHESKDEQQKTGSKAGFLLK